MRKLSQSPATLAAITPFRMKCSTKNEWFHVILRRRKFPFHSLCVWIPSSNFYYILRKKNEDTPPRRGTDKKNLIYGFISIRFLWFDGNREQRSGGYCSRLAWRSEIDTAIIHPPSPKFPSFSCYWSLKPHKLPKWTREHKLTLTREFKLINCTPSGLCCAVFYTTLTFNFNDLSQPD